jgi:hypothetical protein
VTFAAEPYAQFVDDLLLGLTGGVVRERFTFLPDQLSYRLDPPGPLLPGSLQVYGLADQAYRRFRLDIDFKLSADNAIEWRAAGATPAADAIWPDEGADFFTNYDFRPVSAQLPQLSDRNPGSVTRLVAESLAREFAVLSRQLAGIYRAAFLSTSTGRDLDELVSLVGQKRRTAAFATGRVVFSRASAAPADIFVPAGTKVSTSQPPQVTFETSESRTLNRGSLSVEVPVQSEVAGPVGVVQPNTITAINRAVLGIEQVANPEATALGSTAESDDALRVRARRALAGAGKATNDAMIAALTSIEKVRDKDIRFEEDPIRRPGVVTLKVAVELDDDEAARAVDLIEATRPVGVRILHDLHTAASAPSVTPPAGENDGRDDASSAEATASGSGLFFPVVVTAVLLPTAASLSARDRAQLKRKGEDAIKSFVADAGIGETLIYNRLVTRLMELDGVQDADVELYPLPSGHDLPAFRRRNVNTPRTQRPTLDPHELGVLQVDVGGELVALDIEVAVQLKGLALDAGIDPAVILDDIRLMVLADLNDDIDGLSELSPESLRGLLSENEDYAVVGLSYRLEFVDAGVRTAQPDLTVVLDQRQRPWVRRLSVQVASVTP